MICSQTELQCSPAPGWSRPWESQWLVTSSDSVLTTAATTTTTSARISPSLLQLPAPGWSNNCHENNKPLIGCSRSPLIGQCCSRLCLSWCELHNCTLQTSESPVSENDISSVLTELSHYWEVWVCRADTLKSVSCSSEDIWVWCSVCAVFSSRVLSFRVWL